MKSTATGRRGLLIFFSVLLNLILPNGASASIALTQSNLNPASVKAGSSIVLWANLKFSESLASAQAQIQIVDANGKQLSVVPYSLGNVAVGQKALYVTDKIPIYWFNGVYHIAIQVSAIGHPSEAVSLPSVISFQVTNGVDPAPPPVTPLSNSMHITLNDNFSNGLDRSIWTPGIAKAGESNSGEIQHYVPSEVIPLPNGGIRLGATKRSFQGKNITAGAISSAEGFSQLYGHFEMKAKMAGGPGTWPAFWLLSVDNAWPPEIDIFEYLGRLPTQQHVATIFVDPAKPTAHKNVGGYVQANVNLSEDFHVYSLDWLPGVLVYSIDGKEMYRTTDGVSKKPMYILANLAFGGSWAGPITAATPFPAAFDISYIRAFQYDEITDPAPKRFLTLGKSQLNLRQARAGDTLILSGSVSVGAVPLQNVIVHADLTAFLNTTLVGNDNYIKLGDVEANGQRSFSIQMQIPAGTPDGIYNVKVSATTNTSVLDPVTDKLLNNVYRGLADQLTVGNPLP